MKQNEIYNIHKRMIVCDAHCDTVDRLMTGKSELGIRQSTGHIDIYKMIDGGVDVQVFACCVYDQGMRLIEEKISVLHKQFSKYSSFIKLAKKLSDVNQADKDGKLSGIFAIEGGRAIENKIENLKKFYDLGVRLMTINWKSTDWSDASQQEAKHNGLTNFGKEVIKEMNKLGMMIDISHSSDKTVMDVLKISDDPVIASHSNAKALCDHPRNLNDQLIKEIASANGVICVNFYPPFVRKYKAGESQRPSYKRVVDHIEHIIKVGGINCVGLGSDFDGIDKVVEGLEDATKMPRITEELLARGYPEEEIVKIMGGNFLSIFGRVCGI